MKQVLSLFLAFAFVVVLCPVVFASPADQIQTGFNHIVNAPRQIPDAWNSEPAKSKCPVLGYAGAVVKGVVFTFADVMRGGVEILLTPVVALSELKK